MLRSGVARAVPGRPAVCAALAGLASWLLAASTGGAADPAWWAARGAVTNATPVPDAAVNQGQLKQFTLRAVQELNASLAAVGGAGDALNGLVDGWQQDYAARANTVNPADFNVVTVGQLKYIASLIYGRFQVVGYLGAIPAWIKAKPATDSAAAAAGELKTVFNFDPGLDPSGSGLPIMWERFYNVPPGTDADALSPRGDGLTYRQAFQQGLNPNGFYYGQAMTLKYVKGDKQEAAPGGFVPEPLVVSAADGHGDRLVNAPVAFTIVQGGGQFQKASSGRPAAPLTVFTDGEGNARVYYQLPAGALTGVNVIHAVPGSGSHSPPVPFEERPDGSGRVHPSPFAPTNVTAYRRPDGSEDLSWVNHTDEQTPVIIYEEVAGGGLTPLLELPPGTTSYHFPARP